MVSCHDKVNVNHLYIHEIRPILHVPFMSQLNEEMLHTETFSMELGCSEGKGLNYHPLVCSSRSWKSLTSRFEGMHRSSFLLSIRETHSSHTLRLRPSNSYSKHDIPFVSSHI